MTTPDSGRNVYLLISVGPLKKYFNILYIHYTKLLLICLVFLCACEQKSSIKIGMSRELVEIIMGKQYKIVTGNTLFLLPEGSYGLVFSSKSFPIISGVPVIIIDSATNKIIRIYNIE